MDNLERIQEVLTRGDKFDIRKLRFKEEFYAFYKECLLGNRPRIWDSYDEILKSDWKGDVCMRSNKGMGVKRKQTTYNVPLKNVPDEIKKWGLAGFPEKTIAFNQSMPDEHLIMQGEYTGWTHYGGGAFVLYTTIKEPMNLALDKESKHADGFKADYLIKKTFCQSSYDDLQELLEVFPRSIVEFSVYDIEVGNMPGRNVIIWEVRNY